MAMIDVRRIAAGALVTLTLVAAASVEVMAFAGRDVTDSQRFAAAAARTAASPAGSQAIARELMPQLQAALGNAPVPLSDVEAAVAREAQTETFRTEVQTALAASHDALLTDPAAGFVIPTGALRPAVVGAVGPLVAFGGASVPAAADFPAVRVDVPPDARPLVGAVRTVRDVWTLAVPVAIAALVLAAFLSYRPGGTVRLAGVGLTLLAAVPFLIHDRLPASAAGWAAADGASARVFANDITADWLIPTVLMVLIGWSLIALGTWINRWSARPRRA